MNWRDSSPDSHHPCPFSGPACGPRPLSLSQRERVLNAVIALAALASIPLVARAEVTYSETGGEQSVTVIRMTVTPAAEPVPALRHRLVAREIDLVPGNAAPYYYRAMLDLPQVMERVHKEYGEEFDRWYDIGTDAVAIDELPLERVRGAVEAFQGIVLDSLNRATTRRGCDWELGLEELKGIETIAFLLPDIQQSRNLLRVIALRTRLALAEGRYDDAIEAMRMNYRLAGDTARQPLLVCALVGIAEAVITNGTLIELMAAPDSPNFYWALSELPQPMIDTRDAIRFEMNLAFRMLPFLHDAETADHSSEEWNRLLTGAVLELSQVADSGGPSFNEFGAGLAATGLALAGYPYAKEQLVAQGMAHERIEAMPVGQVMAIYTARNCRRLTDDFEKLWYMPFWEMRKRSEAFTDELRAARPLEGGANREVLPIATLLLPDVLNVRTPEVRLEREIAALRVIEALRMYAAENDGRLPTTLDEIHQVPVPLNPATGQPFEYHLDSGKAVLELPASDGILHYYPRRFEITVAQQSTQ